MISKLLMNQDLHFPSVYGTVDEKAQATTYLIADYIDTIDIDYALWIYRGVTLLTDLQITSSDLTKNTTVDMVFQFAQK